MFNKFLCLTIISMLAFVTSAILTPVQAHDKFTKTNDKDIEEALPGPNGENTNGSVDAVVHGEITRSFAADPVDIHLHGYAYLHHLRKGNCTLAAEVKLTAEGKKKWKGASPEGIGLLMHQSRDGFYKDFKLEKSLPTVRDDAPGGEVWWNSYVDWQISSTSVDTSAGGVATDFMKNGVRDAAPDENGGDGGEEEEEEEENDFVDPDTSTLGITLANSDQTFQPGDSVSLELLTADPFYNVSWYVHTPGDTSSSGTYQSDSYGDGATVSAWFSYTIPSGAMHTGDYLFRALIYRWSDMSYVGEETYTVSVSSE